MNPLLFSSLRQLAPAITASAAFLLPLPLAQAATVDLGSAT